MEDQFKTNYEQLKKEYNIMRDERVAAELQLEKEVSRSETINKHSESVIATLRKEISLLQQQLYDFEKPDGKLDKQRNQIIEELVSPLQNTISSLESKLSEQRTTCTTLRQDYMFLATEFSNAQEHHQLTMSELIAKQQSEMDALSREKEAALERLRSDFRTETAQFRDIQRENVKLASKVKDLQQENDQLISKRTDVDTQTTMWTKLQEKQISELRTVIQAITSERDSTVTQLSGVQSQVNMLSAENADLTTKLHHLEQERSRLRGQLSELSHSREVDVANVKLDASRARSALEREFETAKSRVNDLVSQLEMARDSEEQHRAQAINRENEIATRVHEAKAEEWKRFEILQLEKIDIERKLHDVESSLAEINTLRSEINALRTSTNELSIEKDRLTRDLTDCRKRLDEATSSTNKPSLELSSCRADNERLTAALKKAEVLNTQLEEINAKWQREYEGISKEVWAFERQRAKLAETHRAQLESERRTWTTEVDARSAKLKDAQIELAKQRKLNEKIMLKAGDKMKRLKYELKDLASRYEKARSEVENHTVGCVPIEEHRSVCSQLREFYRRHRDFSKFLSADVTQMYGGANERSYSAVVLSNNDVAQTDSVFGRGGPTFHSPNPPIRIDTSPLSELPVSNYNFATRHARGDSSSPHATSLDPHGLPPDYPKKMLSPVDSYYVADLLKRVDEIADPVDEFSADVMGEDEPIVTRVVTETVVTESSSAAHQVRKDDGSDDEVGVTSVNEK